MASDLFELPIHIVIGSTLAFLICTTAIYLYNKKPEFLWYGVYLLAIIIYFSFKSSVTHKLLYPEPNVLTYSIHDASQILFQAAYLLFAIYFLNTQKYYPKLHTFFKVVLGFLGLFITVHVFLYLAGNSRANQIMLLNINRILMIGVFAFNTIYILVNVKTPLVYFILLGSFCFVIGSVLTWFTEDFHFMTYGVGLENIVFAYGLGYKVKQINEERVNAEQEAFQNQMSSLRAQMNPHFIFNSLNSILGFILKGDKKESIRYLSNFSSLLRKVLNTAEQGSISLEQEISLLKLYLELESLRFDKNFSYTIHVDKKLDIHNLEIPVLLVQPYIENAIIHGLAPKTEGEKNITISFSDANDFITCVIEDSGIGLSAARELKKKKNIYHKSKGMSITQRRIALMNNQNLKGSSKVQIEELFDSEGQPSGTKVSLRIFKPHLD